MRRLGIIMIMALLTLAAVPRGALAANEDLFRQVRATSWAIYLRTPGGLNAVCSATAFRTTPSETLLLTAAHCFLATDRKADFLVTQDHLAFIKAMLTKTGLRIKQGASVTSTEIGDYEGDDWAIVSVRIGNQRTMPIGQSKNLAIGEDVVMVGVPLGMDFLASAGIVGSLDLSLSTLVWNHDLGMNIYAAAGNSGTGVVSVRQRAIVGIVVAGSGTQSSLAIVTPIDLVKP